MAQASWDDAVLARLDTLDTRPPKFSMDGAMTWGRVMQVVDGGTMDICMPLAFPGGAFADPPLLEWRCRVAGVQVPDKEPVRRRGFTEKHRLHHKAAGRRLKAYLTRLLLGRCVWVVVVGRDQWGGRLLVRLFDEPEGGCINAFMLDGGLGRPYGRRVHWSKVELNSIIAAVAAVDAELDAFRERLAAVAAGADDEDDED